MSRRTRSIFVADQGSTSACTGFGLATVVGHLLRIAERPKEAEVSPWMLYSMARRYDEFPGAEDAGSSVRGALKGWFISPRSLRTAVSTIPRTRCGWGRW